MKTPQPEHCACESYLYVTCDEHIFFEKEKAVKHANTLPNRRIKTLSRQEADRQAACLEQAMTKSDDIESLLDELTED